MKKIILIFTLVLSVFLLTSCGSALKDEGQEYAKRNLDTGLMYSNFSYQGSGDLYNIRYIYSTENSGKTIIYLIEGKSYGEEFYDVVILENGSYYGLFNFDSKNELDEYLSLTKMLMSAAKKELKGTHNFDYVVGKLPKDVLQNAVYGI